MVSSLLPSSLHHREKIDAPIKKWSINIWVELLLEDLLILTFYIFWVSKIKNYFYHALQWLHDFWQLTLLWHLLTSVGLSLESKSYKSWLISPKPQDWKLGCCHQGFHMTQLLSKLCWSKAFSTQASPLLQMWVWMWTGFVSVPFPVGTWV